MDDNLGEGLLLPKDNKEPPPKRVYDENLGVIVGSKVNHLSQGLVLSFKRCGNGNGFVFLCA
jgi:hypothetical protein